MKRNPLRPTAAPSSARLPSKRRPNDLSNHFITQQKVIEFSKHNDVPSVTRLTNLLMRVCGPSLTEDDIAEASYCLTMSFKQGYAIAAKKFGGQQQAKEEASSAPATPSPRAKLNLDGLTDVEKLRAIALNYGLSLEDYIALEEAIGIRERHRKEMIELVANSRQTELKIETVCCELAEIKRTLSIK